MTHDITRRDVLRGLGGLALAGTVGCGEREPGAPTGEIDQSIQTRSTATIASIANQAIPVNKVEAYAQKSVAAGDTIDFRVSSPWSYQLSIVRLGWDTDTPVDNTGMPVGDWTLHTFPEADPSPQMIHPGSYIHVEAALNPTSTFTQLTLEIWLRPFRTNPGSYWQGLLAQYKNPGQCGFVLGLDDANVPFCYFGNGGAYDDTWLCTSPSSLSALQWHHVVAVFNAGTTQLYVDGSRVKSITPVNAPSVVTPGAAPLRIGAYGDASGTSYFFDGDVAMPIIYSRALSASEIAARADLHSKPPKVPNDPAVIGCWPLNEEIGPNVADASGCGRTGTIVNRGTWMIGGPSFDAAKVDRFDQDYDPDNDPARGHGLRLSWSDLYDCYWPLSQSYTIPSDCLPGVYVGRIIYTDTFTNPMTPTRKRYDVTFVVRVATSRPCAPVLVLCATNTWHAYNNPFQLHSFYDSHVSGQPTYYQGIEMPWTLSVVDAAEGDRPSGADPYLRWPNANTHYSHLVRAERVLHVWLERNGYDHDVMSDRDLHFNPSILSSYQTVFIVGHSEYWTMEGWSAVRNYVASGGNLIVASGNTMFWRVSYDDSVIECRKLPVDLPSQPCGWLSCGMMSGTITSSSKGKWGELYHEHDHRRGGLMREAGYPAWQVTGLDCAGYDFSSFPYKVTNKDHPLFQGPEPTMVHNDYQLGGESGVAHEWDATLQSLKETAIAQGLTPPDDPPADYTVSVLAQAKGTVGFDYRVNWWSTFPDGPEHVLSEIVEWVWSSGGRVFSIGSIAAAQSLNADEKMAALFRNALHANGVVFQLNLLAIGQDGHFNLKGFDGLAWGSEWDDHGAGFGNSPPIGVQWAPNSLAAMAITSNGHFYYKYNVGAGWSPWNDYGSTFVGRPAAVGWGRNRLDLFARGSDAHLYQKRWDGSTFTDWIDLGGLFATDPAAISWGSRRLSVAALAGTGNLYYRENVDESWSSWTNMGGMFAVTPTIVFSGGKRLSLFAVDASGLLWMRYNDGLAGWSGWSSLGSPSGGLAGRVHVACWGELGGFTVFGVGLDGHLHSIYWDGSAWGPWWDLEAPLAGLLVGEPTVASYRGSYISVFCVAADGSVHHRPWNGTTGSWEAWQDFGGAMRQNPAVFRWVGT